MDTRLTGEQRQLRDAAAELSDDLGPSSVADLDNEIRTARLEKAVVSTGWRSLRFDGASGVEVSLVAEEFGRGLVDVAFIGAVLADDLASNVAVGELPPEAVERWRALALVATSADLVGPPEALMQPLLAMRRSVNNTEAPSARIKPSRISWPRAWR